MYLRYTTKINAKRFFFLSSFTSHCIRTSTDEPANRFVIYQSMIKSSLRSGAPRTTFLNQISSHILQSGEKSLEAGEIRKMAMNKSEWSQLFVVSKKKKPPDRYSKLVRWWWWSSLIINRKIRTRLCCKLTKCFTILSI